MGAFAQGEPMGHDYRGSNREPGASTSVAGAAGTAGKRTLIEALPANPASVQRKAAGAASEDHAHEAAQRGVAGDGSPLPHLDAISARSARTT